MTIQWMINIGDDYSLKSVTWEYNDTGLPSNADTLEKVARTILRSIALNQDELVVKDMLDELDISKPKP